MTRASSRLRPVFLLVYCHWRPADVGATGVSAVCELALDRELADTWRTLLNVDPHHDFHMFPACGVTFDELLRLVIELEPAVLYFAGHGVAGRVVQRACAADPGSRLLEVDEPAGILLADQHGGPQLVTAPMLATILATTRSVRTVILNGCHTEAVAGALLAAEDSLHCAIGMSDQILDDAARSFAVSLFVAIGLRLSIGQAFAYARATLDPYCEEHLPKLYPQRGIDAAELFLTRPEDDVAPHRPPSSEARSEERARRPAQRDHLARAAVVLVLLAAGAAFALAIQALKKDGRASVRSAPPDPGSDRLDGEDLVSQLAPLSVPSQTPSPQAPSSQAPSSQAPSSQSPTERSAPHAITSPTYGGHLLQPSPKNATQRPPARIPPRRLAPPPAPARADELELRGELDRATIRRHVVEHRSQIRHCYEQQLQITPSLTGTVNTQFLITPQGTVASPRASGLDDGVASCVANVIERIEFPRSGTGAEVNYPFHFVPER